MKLDIYIISGKARAGKTTIANIIKQYYENKNKKGVVTGFHKYIKMYACDITSWDGVSEPKPRELLQNIGYEVIRNKLGKNDFFIKRIDDDLDVYNEYVDVVIIDDARLPKEIDYYKEKYPENVISIHVNRPNFINDLTPEQNRHFTEIALDNYDKYDYTITNEQSLNDLEKQVISLMEELQK